MKLLRDVWTFLRELPDLIARKLDEAADRRAMLAHAVVLVPGDPADWPGGEQPWCLRCDRSWPCDPFMEASDRLTGRREDGS